MHGPISCKHIDIGIQLFILFCVITSGRSDWLASLLDVLTTSLVPLLITKNHKRKLEYKVIHEQQMHFLDYTTTL